MKTFRILILIAVVVIFLYACAALTTSRVYFESDLTCVIGRMNYLTFTFKDEFGNPIANQPAQLTLMGKTYIATTDDYGRATFSILATKNFEGTHTATASLVYNPSISISVTLSFVRPNWLVLIWFGADNDLDDYALSDLQELETVGYNQNFSAVVMLDRPIGKQDGTYVLSSNGSRVLIDPYTDPYDGIDSGSGDFLEEWLTKQLKNFVANRYALIIWNHGNAWIDDGKEQFKPKAISYDGPQNNALTTSELADAIRNALSKVGLQKLDVLGFDACLMGSFEVLYEVKDLAKYAVASSFSEPAYGWDYTFLGGISSSTDSFEFSKRIVDFYREFAKRRSDYQTYVGIGLSLAVYDLEKADDLNNVLNNLAAALMNHTGVVRDLNYSNVVTYVDNLLFDMKQLCETWSDNFNDLEIKAKINSVIEKIENFVVYYYAEKKVDNSVRQIYHPLSIFFTTNPTLFSKYQTDYMALSFSQSNWFNLIASLCN
ncbi:clostripain-related cysteine peptidase [Pseudothermotoga thermarum]|uniref:Peptidase C11 clostripain n=1 Tax=Pseudothermotoga thermarum DSM 5069 TaxID=688269 RepID=F7YXA7_9THEM|nr:clostripain-related cysteine peptidase [Pseudothermotoga thermarum]AEH51423.1 peptidase C11 clostripain [Pseudothermotoga thermarum DSM 5069]